MNTDFLHGTVHEARDDLQAALKADPEILDLWQNLTPLGRNEFICWVVVIPAQPSPFDGWASAEMLRMLDEARVYRPELRAVMLLNRCGARTVIARETAAALEAHDPPVLASRVGQRVAFADAARTGRLAGEVDGGRIAEREIAALAHEIEGLAS